jgi:hypothetical protein
MVQEDRLISPPDDFEKAFPGLGFPNKFILETTGEPILVTDPTYLADVYNTRDEESDFLRSRGVFLMDFGGDISCPALWKSPYLLLPLVDNDDSAAQEEAAALTNEIACDSGSLVFLPYRPPFPASLKDVIAALLQENNAWLLSLPAGRWHFYYEQYPSPSPNQAGLFRNIVARHEQVST